mmetsp:Transcript_33065/g.48461  ORF Transcript_33065/g.48461 Transcript_33065/m.48461 type:complete len:147 (+) Transcript_33065:366-806(+)
MQGLPIGYVSEPVKKLFDDLTQKAFVNAEQTTEKLKSWRDILDRDLWHFRKCRFRVKPQRDVPFFNIQLSIPKEGKKKDSLLNEQQYCKHLIGNGWSIPVVEFILDGLKGVCEERKSYDGYAYNYPWLPYKSKSEMGKFSSAQYEV